MRLQSHIVGFSEEFEREVNAWGTLAETQSGMFLELRELGSSGRYCGPRAGMRGQRYSLMTLIGSSLSLTELALLAKKPRDGGQPHGSRPLDGGRWGCPFAWQHGSKQVCRFVYSMTMTRRHAAGWYLVLGTWAEAYGGYRSTSWRLGSSNRDASLRWDGLAVD